MIPCYFYIKGDIVNMTNDEYKRLADSRQPRSRLIPNLLKAFFVGGLICCLGQLFIDIYSSLGLNKDDAGSLASVSLVFLGALTTGLGLYDRLGKFAGGGSLVPITGFANSVVSPALEFKTEGLISGTAAKMFVIAGPVIVYGISASVVYGLIYWLCI